MRIAYINADPGVAPFGRKGCCIHVREMIRALLRQGATIDLFTLRMGDDLPDPLPAGARAYSARALAGIGEEASEAVPRLTRLLSDNDPDVRRYAAKALRKIGAAASSAVPALERATQDNDERVRDQAQRALAKISQ